MKLLEERSTYFIGNDGERSEKLYFCYAAAVEGSHAYIDFMDANGEYLGTYKLVGAYYTDAF